MSHAVEERRLATVARAAREEAIEKTRRRAALHARAIWGYSTADGVVTTTKAKGKLTDDAERHWDRICVEGDDAWTELPGAIAKVTPARAKPKVRWWQQDLIYKGEQDD